MRGLITGSVLLQVSRPYHLEWSGVDSKDVGTASRKLLEKIHRNQPSQQADFIGSQTLGLRDNRNQELESHRTVSLLSSPLSSLCWLYLFLFFFLLKIGSFQELEPWPSAAPGSQIP